METSTNVAFPLEKLQAYIDLVRDQFHPTLNQDAQTVINAYYAQERARGGQTTARTTIRLLESVIRLAQAHARLMMRPQVEVEDAVQVIWLLRLLDRPLPGIGTLGSQIWRPPLFFSMSSQFPYLTQVIPQCQSTRNRPLVWKKFSCLNWGVSTHSTETCLLPETFRPPKCSNNFILSLVLLSPSPSNRFPSCPFVLSVLTLTL